MSLLSLLFIHVFLKTVKLVVHAKVIGAHRWYVHTYVRPCMCVHVYCVYMHMCVHVYVCMFMYMCMCVCVESHSQV